jgi:hypothetical protein
VKRFVRVWWLGLIRPVRAFGELGTMPTPWWGLSAVLIRFVITALTTTLALLLLGREPFQPSYLTFLPTGDYYRALVFFFPVFGLVAWLLMSCVAYLSLRLAGRVCDFDQVLNIVGMSMLIPMPVLWLWDWLMIALDAYTLTIMAPSHAVVQIWEAGLAAVGFRRILNLSGASAIALAILINITFVLLGSLFAR